MAGSFQPEAAFINASLLPDLAVLHAAAHKALTAEARGTLRTKTVYAEVVFNIAASKHVRPPAFLPVAVRIARILPDGCIG